MTESLQTIAALAIVVVTGAIFLRKWLRRRDQKGCGGGCGCQSQKLKREAR